MLCTKYFFYLNLLHEANIWLKIVAIWNSINNWVKLICGKTTPWALFKMLAIPNISNACNSKKEEEIKQGYNHARKTCLDHWPWKNWRSFFVISGNMSIISTEYVQSQKQWYIYDLVDVLNMPAKFQLNRTKTLNFHLKLTLLWYWNIFTVNENDVNG